jgi:hypothetical protein
MLPAIRKINALCLNIFKKRGFSTVALVDVNRNTYMVFCIDPVHTLLVTELSRLGRNSLERRRGVFLSALSPQQNIYS